MVKFPRFFRPAKKKSRIFPGTILRQTRGDLSGLGGIEKTHLLPEIVGISSRDTGWGPSSFAKLVQITIITIVYDTYNL
jgi:hypothetical protein